MATGQGGQCPTCGESVPEGSVRCRFCNSPIELEAEVEAVPSRGRPGEAERTVPGVIGGLGKRLPRWHFVGALACLAILLLAPLCVSRSVRKPLSLGFPGVLSGDEPHYLVIINSILSDRDFDLANNYQDVHRGGLQAGRRFAGEPLDHHVNWYENGRLVKWWQAYEMDVARWSLDSDGHPVPTPRADSNFRPVNGKEYSQHPVGLPFLLAPILFPLRGTALVEPAALLCSGLASVVGCCAWCWLVRPYTKSAGPVLVAAAVAYLGSPLWHYGQTLYSEPFLACFSVAAFAAALRGDNYLVAGLLLGAGILVKAPFGLIALPLIGDALVRRRWRQALACALPIGLAALLVLYWNRQMYGGWLRNPQEWEPGSLADGALGLLCSRAHGLLLVSPALGLSAIVLPVWFRKHRRDAILMSLATLLYGGLMADWAQWWGGTCYSARLILPIVPFLFAPLPLLFETTMWRRNMVVWVVGTTLMIVSIDFGAISAFGCDYVLKKHPLEVVW